MKDAMTMTITEQLSRLADRLEGRAASSERYSDYAIGKGWTYGETDFESAAAHAGEAAAYRDAAKLVRERIKNEKKANP